MNFNQLSKKIAITGICIMCLALSTISSLAAPPSDSDWDMVFSDEFNGTEMDLTTWIRNAPDEGDEENLFWWGGDAATTLTHPDTVSVSDGYMKFDRIEFPESAPFVYKEKEFTSFGSSVTTRGNFEFQYGYAEIRMKYADNAPSGGAFWLMPTWSHYDSNLDGVLGEDESYFNFYGLGGQGAEIDVVEHFDGWMDRQTGGCAIHWGGYDNLHQVWDGGLHQVSNNINQFHTYGVEWTPTDVKIYWDNQLVSQYSGEAVPQCPEFLVVTGGPGIVGEQQLTDYIRVYKKKPVIQEDTYLLRNKYSGAYLTPENYSVEDAANIYQLYNSGSNSQQWKLEYVGDGNVYKIKNIASGKYLDVFGEQTQNMANVIQYHFLDGWNNSKGLNQLWRITPATEDDQYFRIAPLHAPNKFLLAVGNQNYDTVVIDEFHWNDHRQMWKIHK